MARCTSNCLVYRSSNDALASDQKLPPRSCARERDRTCAAHAARSLSAHGSAYTTRSLASPEPEVAVPMRCVQQLATRLLAIQGKALRASAFIDVQSVSVFSMETSQASKKLFFGQPGALSQSIASNTSRCDLGLRASECIGGALGT